MTFISIFCAMLGFLSPANRGSMLTVTLLLFVLMGATAGYCAAVTYKAFHGGRWRALTLLTAFLYPGITFGIFFVLNFFIWGQASSGAVPFTTLFALLCMWFLVSFPLVWIGVWLGYRRTFADPPVKTNMVPRVVPSQAWYLNQLFTMLIGGILPFGAVFIELYFIMSSVWLQRFYYVFGFLALVLLILIITCAEMAVVLAYFQLCNENYAWQWRSFLNTASAGTLHFFAGRAPRCTSSRPHLIGPSPRGRRLPLRLLIRLLLVDPRDHGLRLNTALLRVHVHHEPPLLARHRHRRIRRLVVVHIADIRRRQSRLALGPIPDPPAAGTIWPTLSTPLSTPSRPRLRSAGLSTPVVRSP